jgi:hypothetical protein
VSRFLILRKTYLARIDITFNSTIILVLLVANVVLFFFDYKSLIFNTLNDIYFLIPLTLLKLNIALA